MGFTNPPSKTAILKRWASKLCLQKAGTTADDIDVWEIN